MNAPLSTVNLRVTATRDERFERLYRAEHSFVWRCARRMGVDESEIEDVLQDVFVIAYHRLETLDPGIKPSSWLFGILRNVVRNRARGRGRQKRRVDAFASQVAFDERRRQRVEQNLGEAVLIQELLADFLGQLDDKQRTVFVLAELEGYSGKEIGAALGIKTNTAHSRLRLARKAFRTHFDGEQGEHAERLTRELRERPEEAPAKLQAHGFGLILAAVGAPVHKSAPLAVLSSFVSAKAAIATAIATAAVSVSLMVGFSEPASTGTDTDTKSRTHVELAGQEAGSPRHARSLALPSKPAPEVALEPSEPIVVQTPARRSELEPRPAKPPVASKAAVAAEQLRQARAALIGGEAALALELLGAIPRSHSHLFAQRMATQVAAQCQLGQVEAARASVEELREREPGSALLTRIDHACW